MSQPRVTMLHYSADKIISHRPTQTDTSVKCASDFTGQADIFLSVVRTSTQISETFLKPDSLKVGFGKIIPLEK
jgi:hypothetical protein